MGWREKNRGRGRENINSSGTDPDTARGELHERLSSSGKGHSTEDADFAVAGSWSRQEGAQDCVKGSGRAGVVASADVQSVGSPREHGYQ